MDKWLANVSVLLWEVQILDAALIANEGVDELVYKKQEGVLCKLDMENTYNHVN